MKRSRFSEAQVAFILRQVDEGTTVGEVCRKAGISEATFYVWRKKYAGLMPSEMTRRAAEPTGCGSLRRRTDASSGSWRTCRSTRRCCRT